MDNEEFQILVLDHFAEVYRRLEKLDILERNQLRLDMLIDNDIAVKISALFDGQVSHGQRLERIEQHLGAHDQKFEGIDQRQATHDQRFDRIEQHLEAQDHRFDRQDERLERVEQRVEEVATDVGYLVERVTALEKLAK